MIGRERGVTPDKIGKEKGEFGRGRGVWTRTFSVGSMGGRKACVAARDLKKTLT